MNQEYLWSKIGSDADVERLEGLLAEYRFDESSAIEMPATNIIPVAATLPKRRFSWILAFAASAVAVILVTIWILAPRPVPVAKVEENAAAPVPETARSKTDDPPEYRSGEPAKVNLPTAEHMVASKAQVIYRRRTANRGQSVTKSKTEKLTKEEKYAYNRLMFALSIAGSKLKVVQDTIDRKGDTTPQIIRNEK